VHKRGRRTRTAVSKLLAISICLYSVAENETVRNVVHSTRYAHGIIRVDVIKYYKTPNS
jgi:hypothetical protein